MKSKNKQCLCCKDQKWYCACSNFSSCNQCVKCLNHCVCRTRGEVLSQLREQQQYMVGLLTEANKTAVSLGLEELDGDWDTDQLFELENRLRIQLLAVKRLSRRFSKWESITVDLGELGDPETQAQNKEVEFLNPPYIESSGNQVKQ